MKYFCTQFKSVLLMAATSEHFLVPYEQSLHVLKKRKKIKGKTMNCKYFPEVHSYILS